MPELKNNDWDDMLESDGYLTFLKGIEDAMDEHLLRNSYRFAKFLKHKFKKKASSDDWIDLKRGGVVVSSDQVLIAYNEHIALMNITKTIK